MATYCKVAGCRFSQFHTTIAHRCGTCHQYGHGQMECNNIEKKNQLTMYINDQMPSYRWCSYTNCTYPWSHSSESHHCYICGIRSNHSALNCQQNQQQYLEQTHQEWDYLSDISGSSIVNSLVGAATKSEEVVTIDTSILQNKTCPMCVQTSDVDINMKIFTDAKCVICIESGPKVIFSGCKHAIICDKCILHL